MSIRQKYSLSLNAATIKQASLQQQIELTGDCGFDGIGLWIDDIQAAKRRGLSLKDIAEKIKEAGLTVTELCFANLSPDPGQAGFEAVLARTRQICKTAQALACDIVVGVPAMTAEVTDITADGLRQIGRAAWAYNVRLALEFPGNAYRINNLARAWQLISQAENANVGLLLDTFHFFLGNSRTEVLATVPAEKIFLVHVSDAMDVGRDKLSTFHDYRIFPGEGVINYCPVFDQLSKKNYRGTFSLEIWNQDLLSQEPAEAAHKGYASLKSLIQKEFRP